MSDHDDDDDDEDQDSTITAHGPPPVGLFAKDFVWDIFGVDGDASSSGGMQQPRHKGPPPVGVFLKEHGEEIGVDLDALKP